MAASGGGGAGGIIEAALEFGSGILGIISNNQQRKIRYQEWLNSNPVIAREYFSNSTRLLMVFAIMVLPIIVLMVIFYLNSKK